MTRPRTASLPMYDANRDAVTAWWTGLAASMRAEGLDDVPESPSWPDRLDDHWRDPSLLLSQTCGFPLVDRLCPATPRDSTVQGVQAVQVVGAMRYAAQGCEGVGYRSELVVRNDEPAGHLEAFRGRTAAVNSYDSHSGFNALRAQVAPLAVNGRFFDRTVATGSHRRSLAHVRDGLADIAAIDCVTLALLRIHAPQALHGLRVIGHTATAPGLPVITSAATSPADLAALRRAIAAAVAEPSLADARAALLIDGFEATPRTAWQVIDDRRRAALELGCHTL